MGVSFSLSQSGLYRVSVAWMSMDGTTLTGANTLDLTFYY